MTIAEIIASGGGVLILMLSLVQVAPIKVSPWSAMMKAIGRALNVEVMDKLNESEANSARYRIIRFDDEIRLRTRHTEEHFNQILDDIDIYERYCAGHPEYPNSKAKSAVTNIRAVYQKCRDDNDFLV